MDSSSPKRGAWLQRIPSIVWIFIFIGGLALLIATIGSIFYALTNFEGFASFLMLLAGWVTLRAGAPRMQKYSRTKPAAGDKMMLAIGIGFFALMGMAIDQPGNPLYNLPLEWIYCPNGSDLQRGVTVTHPIPGRTNITQDFVCERHTAEGVEVARQINPLEVIPVRLVEYVFIGYALVGLGSLLDRWNIGRRRRKERALHDGPAA